MNLGVFCECTVCVQVVCVLIWDGSGGTATVPHPIPIMEMKHVTWKYKKTSTKHIQVLLVIRFTGQLCSCAPILSAFNSLITIS